MKEPKTYFIEVYKSIGENDSCQTELLPTSCMGRCLANTANYKNLETIAVFKVTPKTK